MPPPLGAAAAVSSPPEPLNEPTPAMEPAAPRLESTFRALATGLALGVVLAAANVYTGLKTGWIDGGSITAALLSFTLFAAFRRSGRAPYTALENNITQTVASSAAIMGFAMGLAGPVPALALLGLMSPPWAIMAWGIAISLVGIFAGVLLRRKLVVDSALPFPTGLATAELIDSMYAARSTAVRRAAVLGAGALVAMIVTWLRDGPWAWIPQAAPLWGSVGGIAAGTLTLGISWSPLMASTGALMGVRAAASMALGGLIAWAGLAPRVLTQHLVADTTFTGTLSWMVWPALGLLIAGSFIPLLLELGVFARAFRDLASFVFRRSGSGASSAPAASTGERHTPRPVAVLVLASVGVIVVVGRMVFGIHPAVTVGALLMAMLLANICGRAAGETDIGPVGQVGTLTQIIFAGYGTLATVVTGWLSMGASSQAVQSLWAFRAGQRLGASPRAQIGAQVLGALLGGAVVVPVYIIIVNAYGVANATMPAPSAVSFKATAQAVQGGLGALPQYGPMAAGIALAAGVALTLLDRTRLGRFLPSPAAMGIGMLTPSWLSMTALGGALLVTVIRRLRPSWDEPTMAACAAGGIAGESIMGVIVAALMAAGVL